jgi:hypothetical protein
MFLSINGKTTFYNNSSPDKAITGIVLAGGISSRMGKDKSTLS